MTGRIDGVLFDVDDTLVDTMAAFGDAIDAIARSYLPALPEARYPELLEHWRDDPAGHYARYTRGETDAVTQRRLRAELLHRSFGGEPLTEAGFAAWDELFWGTFESSWRPFEDARRTVDALRAAGVPVGVVTNAGAELQQRKLRAAGLGDLPVHVGLDTLGVGKPAPEVFLEGARRLGTDPALTVYIGDEPAVDAAGAAGAGLRGVWLDRPGRRRVSERDTSAVGLHAAGVAVIGGLDELPRLLGLDGAAGER